MCIILRPFKNVSCDMCRVIFQEKHAKMLGWLLRSSSSYVKKQMSILLTFCDRSSKRQEAEGMCAFSTLLNTLPTKEKRKYRNC